MRKLPLVSRKTFHFHFMFTILFYTVTVQILSHQSICFIGGTRRCLAYIRRLVVISHIGVDDHECGDHHTHHDKDALDFDFASSRCRRGGAHGALSFQFLFACECRAVVLFGPFVEIIHWDVIRRGRWARFNISRSKILNLK